jgi:hypothetical protein
MHLLEQFLIEYGYLDKYMRILLAVLLLAFWAGAHAQQNYPRNITITYTQPTLYDDGTTIDAGELATNRFECSRHDATVVVAESRPVTALPGGSQSEAFTGVIPQPGTYTCFVWVSTVDTESDASLPDDQKFTGKPLPVTDVIIVVP